jgi:hypothetical protein
LIEEIFVLKKRRKRKRFDEDFLCDSFLLDPLVPFNAVGHVEIISLLLFFVGKEKSFRGQQFTSIWTKFSIETNTNEEKPDEIFGETNRND